MSLYYSVVTCTLAVWFITVGSRGVTANSDVHCVSPTGLTFTVNTNADAMAFPANCNVIAGNLDIQCTAGMRVHSV